MEGCAEGFSEHKVFRTLVNPADHRDRYELSAWHCARCGDGYLEDRQTWSPSEEITFFFLGMAEEDKQSVLASLTEEEQQAWLTSSRLVYMRQTCRLAPCGEDCEDCAAKRHKSWGGKVTMKYACQACAGLLPESGADNLQALEKSEMWKTDSFVVQNRCSRMSDRRALELDFGELLARLVRTHFGPSSWTDGLPTGPGGLLEVVQLLDLIGRQTRSAFQLSLEARGLDAAEAWGDMVEKGVDFEAQLLNDNLEFLGSKEELRSALALMAASPVLAELQGGLQLCMEFAWARLGSARWPDNIKQVMEWKEMKTADRCAQEAKWNEVRSRCTRIHGTFSQIFSAVARLVGGEAPNRAEVPEYTSVLTSSAKKPRDLVITVAAPRKTVVEVLRMVGFFDRPTRVVPVDVMASTCSDLNAWLASIGEN